MFRIHDSTNALSISRFFGFELWPFMPYYKTTRRRGARCHNLYLEIEMNAHARCPSMTFSADLISTQTLTLMLITRLSTVLRELHTCRCVNDLT